MKRVLFIVPDFFTDLPQQIRSRKFVENLGGRYEMHVLTFCERQLESGLDQSYVHHQVHPNRFVLFLLSAFGLVHNHRRGENQRRHTCLLALKRILPRPLIRWVLFPDSYILGLLSLRSTLKLILVSDKYDVVIGSAYPFTVFLLGATVRKISPHAKWILDVGDPFFGSITGFQSRLWRRITWLFERVTLRHASTLILTNEATKDHYIQHFGQVLAGKELLVVGQGTDVIPHISGSHRQLPASGLFRLVYAGVFYDKIREPYPLYSAVSCFDEQPIVLEVYGHIAHRFFPKQGDPKFDRIRILGSVPHEEIPLKYQNASAVVYIDNAEGFQSSGKLYELIASKKPIIFIQTQKDSEARKIISNYGGVVFAQNETFSICGAFQKVLKGHFAFEFDLSSYLWENKANQLAATIDS